MKKLSLAILLAVLPLLSFADNGQWNLYLSYNGTPQDIESADKFIYVQVNNCLYSYNRNDHSVKTFSRQNGLSDVCIKTIAWAKAVKKLVVLYENGNIDLLCNGGKDTENISDYCNYQTVDDKAINSIYVKDNIMLMATNFGVVKIDLRKAEIMETYRLQRKFRLAGFDDKYLYGLAAGDQILYKGDRTKNLLDPKSWTQEPWSGQFSFATVNDETNPEDKAIVETLTLDDSPKNNQISRLLFDNGRLLVAAGGLRENIDNPSNYKMAAISEYVSGSGWTHYEPFQSAAKINGYREVTQFAVNPADSKHIFVGTWGDGAYEFYDRKQRGHHTQATSNVIGTALNENHPNADSYVILAGLCFDAPNSLYLLNSQSKHALIHCDISKFTALSHSELMGFQDNTRSRGELISMIRAADGILWFVNNHPWHPAVYKYNPQTDNITEYATLVNQDGTNLTTGLRFMYYIAEDKDRNIWVATPSGPMMLTPQLQQDPSAGFIQFKVPRNDGSNFADYLLNNVAISCIAIDGGNRKWFGTFDNGVYLISADNMQQIAHFTKDNSQLLDNEIRDIAINPQTGEVFFATNKGLCSIMSDATQPKTEMDKDNAWAYPNPVSPDYTGEITIVGLSYNSRITITTSSGHLVASGTSTGGSFKWNGCDTKGKRVASGIYMVHAATSEGESGVVCKVAVIR